MRESRTTEGPFVTVEVPDAIHRCLGTLRLVPSLPLIPLLSLVISVSFDEDLRRVTRNPLPPKVES